MSKFDAHFAPSRRSIIKGAGALAAVTSTVDVPRHSSVIVAAKREADYYRTTNAVANDQPKGWS